MPALRSFLHLEKLDDRWLPDATEPTRLLSSDVVIVQVGDPPVLPVSPPATPTPPPPTEVAPNPNPPPTTPVPTPTATVETLPTEIQNWVDYVLGNTPEAKLKRLPAPVNGPLYEDGKAPGPDSVGRVTQGGMGDCWFVATAIALGTHRPSDIVSMIADNKDGTYTVTFPGGKIPAVTITYDAQAPGEQGKDGIWVRVLEQAAAKHWNDKAWFKSADPLQQIANGAPTSDAIKLLTGNDYYHKMGHSPFDNEKSWEDGLTGAFQNNKVVVLTTQGKSNQNGPTETDNGIVRNHAYAVIGYNAETKTLKLRNPWAADGEWGQTLTSGTWGNAPDGNANGIFEISLADAYKTFYRIDFEK